MTSTDANVAYAAQSDATLNKMLAIYTIIPAIFVVLQGLPILAYDMVGEKKEMITKALMERREAAKANETDAETATEA